MTTSTAQFYATRSELIDMTVRWHQLLGCWATVMIFSPDFGMESFGPKANLLADSRHLYHARRICFTLDEPVGSAESPYDFMTMNPNALVFDMGESSQRGIGESALGMKTDNPRALKKWQSVFKILKQETSSGVFMVSRKTGQRVFYKNLRYTPGAAEASKSGVELLPLAPAVFGIVWERE